MLEKIWTTQADFEGGTLANVWVPSGLNRLELKRLALSGTGTWVFDGGAGGKFNWQSFEHTVVNQKIIMRDDFRENSLADYYQEALASCYPNYSAPSWDSVNKRVKFDTGGSAYNFTLRPKSVSIQNFILSFDFLCEYRYATNAPIISVGRYINQSNMYYGTIRDVEVEEATSLGKIKNGSDVNIKKSTMHYNLGQEYQLIATVNGNSYKIEVPGLGSLSMTDSDFPNAGGVKFGAAQGRGWIDNFLLEHYSLPSPPNCSISFKFWPSSDGTNWGAECSDIAKVPNSRFIKIQVTLSRTSLLSAMPTLEDMTLGYKLLSQPIFI